jgi:hypothetical protein
VVGLGQRQKPHQVLLVKTHLSLVLLLRKTRLALEQTPLRLMVALGESHLVTVQTEVLEAVAGGHLELGVLETLQAPLLLKVITAAQELTMRLPIQVEVVVVHRLLE